MTGREIVLCDGTCARISDAGPTVILLHGVGLNQGIWAEQVKAFAATHQVVTYDLLGHGKSAAAPENAGLGDWVRQLESVVGELKLARFSLLGFSFGGLIAQAFAAKHAEMIDRLVLMSTVYDRSKQERARVLARLEMAKREGPQAIIAAALERWFSPEFANSHPAVLESYESLLRSNDAKSFLAAYRCFATADGELVGKLSGFDRPALVMTGELDAGSTPAIAKKLAASIPGGSCSILPQARHMMPVERPDEVNAVLQRFLSGGLV